MHRIGFGQDSHKIKFKIKNLKLKIRKNLILGGIEVSQDYYALADSDGDVIIHSLCNALSTAIGGGSLDTWAGAMFRSGITDSREFLKVIFNKVKDLGFKLANVSIMVEAQQPKLEKFREDMQKSLAKLLQINKEQVGIAFTTGQNLTPFGKAQGIQVLSTVLIYK